MCYFVFVTIGFKFFPVEVNLYYFIARVEGTAMAERCGQRLCPRRKHNTGVQLPRVGEVGDGWEVGRWLSDYLAVVGSVDERWCSGRRRCRRRRLGQRLGERGNVGRVNGYVRYLCSSHDFSFPRHYLTGYYTVSIFIFSFI